MIYVDKLAPLHPRGIDEEVFTRILEGSRDFVAVVDPNFRFVYFNSAYREEFRRIFGVEPARGSSLRQVLGHLPQERERAVEIWNRALQGEEFTVTREFGAPAERRTSYEISFQAMRDEQQHVVGATQIGRNSPGGRAPVHEIALNEDSVLRPQPAEAGIADTEQTLRRKIAILEATADMIGAVTPQGEILYLNKAGHRMLGVREEDSLEGRTLADFHPLWAQKIILEEGFPGAIRDGMWQGEAAILDGRGGEIPVSQLIFAHRAPDGALEYLSTFARDLREQKRTEARLLRNERALRALNRCNGALVRAHRESTLLENICRIIVEEGGYRLAWVGYAEHDDARKIRPIASAGEEGNYLKSLSVSWGETAEGRGPAGTAIRTGRPVVVSDVATDPTFEPWRKSAMERGYRSIAAFPLMDAGDPIGVLLINAAEPDSFDSEEIELLSEMADNLAYGIASLRSKKAHERAEKELQAKHELLRTVIDQLPHCISVKDIHGRYLAGNATTQRILNVPDEKALTGRTSFDFYPADIAEAETAEDHQVIRTGLPVIDREEPHCLTGGHGWTSSTKVPLRDHSEGVIGLVAIKRDITEWKRSAQALEESEERFRLLAQVTNDAIWEWDLGTDALRWSDGFYHMFGFARASIQPHISFWTDLIHNEDRERVVTGLRRVIASANARWSDEYRFRRNDGTYAYVSDRGHVIRDAAGKGIRIIGGMTDISERKAGEAQLYEQAQLLDRAQDAILVHDLDGKLLYWNQGAERAYGWTAEEIVGKRFEAYPEDAAMLHHEALEATLKEGEWSGELQQLRKDGRELTVQGRWSCVKNAEGHPKSVLCINTDITEGKKLEAQFLRAQRMESLGTLAGGIAHDLNNVLAPIIMSIDVLKMGVTDPTDLELLDTISQSAYRGAEMVKQVLSFARGMEGNRLQVQPKYLLSDIQKFTVETFPKNIRVVADYPPGLWTVIGDPTQLNQVLLNLCVNARDAMAGGGTLKISAANVVLDEHYAAMSIDATAGPHLVLSVEDTGSGIPRELLDKIFDPFFTTKPVGMGTGLGLSTTLAIIKGHGGFIQVYSEVGRGTKFQVYLPAHDGPAEKVIQEEALDLPRGNGELILVVDDEVSIRRVTQQTLEAFGYRTMVAVDGAEAVAHYAAHRDDIAVVLTDMMMPGLDGAATIRVLMKINPEVRIVAASGISTNEENAKFAGSGVKHFLAKPYTARTLLKVLRDALENRSASSRDVVE